MRPKTSAILAIAMGGFAAFGVVVSDQPPHAVAFCM